MKACFIEGQSRSGFKVEEEAEVKAIIRAYWCPPSSYSKKKRDFLISSKAGYKHKRDCDNIAKIILDSLNGLAYKDDAQVTHLEVYKSYGEEDKVEVEIDYIQEGK